MYKRQHECIGIFDAIDEIAPSLNHTLVHQLLERFFGYGNAEVVQELIPETGVYQVTGGMFGTAYVKVYIVPVLDVYKRQVLRHLSEICRCRHIFAVFDFCVFNAYSRAEGVEFQTCLLYTSQPSAEGGQRGVRLHP